MADARVTMWDGIQSEMAEDGSQKDRDLASGHDFGQGHAGNDMDGGEQWILAVGFGQGPDKSADAVGIDFAGAFQEGTDDETGNFRKVIAKVVQGRAAAEEKRGAGGGGMGTAEVIRICAVAGAGAAEDEGIGAAAFPGVTGLVLDGVARGHRSGVFDIHIGKNPDVAGADPFAETKEFFSNAVEDALVGQAGADENVHADEVSPGGGGHGHGADPVVAEEIDAERSGKKFTGLAGKGGEAGDGGRAGRIGREGSISKVLDDDGVGAALFQGQQVTAHGLADGIKFPTVAGCAGKRGQVNHAEQAFFWEKTSDEFFRGRHS